MKAMLPRVDYLTVHTPLTPETRNLIDHDTLALLKPGVRLINCARGGIYNEAALVEGLKSGKLAGVALDVFENEPCTDSPLFGMPGVLARRTWARAPKKPKRKSPSKRCAATDQLSADGRSPTRCEHGDHRSQDAGGTARLSGCGPSARPALSPVASWRSRPCHLIYRGDVTKKNTQAADGGVLRRPVGRRAGGRSQHRQCRDAACASEASSSRKNHAASPGRSALPSPRKSPVTVETYAAAGTLFGHNMPRLILLGDYRLESYLDGILLVFTHDDVPGIIGAVGTIFGNIG